MKTNLDISWATQKVEKYAETLDMSAKFGPLENR